jgi:FkbM family methyltransferase
VGEGNYEPGTVRIFDAVLKEGNQVVIAGAHQGYFAVHCAGLVGDTGKVLAFEPEPTNRGILTKATEGLRNVEVFPYALGDRAANAQFYINADNDGGHALWDVGIHTLNEKTRANPQVINVEVKTVDELFPDGISRLKLMMLDAEGSELAIIKGAINTIVDVRCPYIITEINNTALKQCGTSQETLRGYLSMYGYTGYVMSDTEVVEAGKARLRAMVGDSEVVFNMLFSMCGAV